MKETTKNFIYNLIYQIFIFIIPLITIPYVSRVLGPNNIGVYSYTYSIVYYFMLGSMLGINNYGSREIAKIKDEDKDKLSKKFLSIYYLQFFCTIIMMTAYLIFCCITKYDYKYIFIIQSIYLLSCVFDINWFFWGKEKFKITIIRNIVVKIFSLILIFLFVKKENDVWIYTLILANSALISQLYLWISMKKEINFMKVSVREIFSNFKPLLILFIPVISYSIYRVLDKTMIGMFSTTFQLGNYESAEKIINIPISIIIALGTIMMPHMSKLENNNDEYKKKISDTYKLCFFLILPIILGIFIVSEDFCNIFFGDKFNLTPNIIKLLLITVIFSCVSNITRSTYLIPKRKDSIYVKSTIFGAVLNLVLNLVFIRKYGAYGACIGTIAAEFMVMIYQIIFTWKDIEYLKNLKSILPFFVKSIIMMEIINFIGNFISITYIRLILQIISGALIYILLNVKYIKYETLKK